MAPTCRRRMPAAARRSTWRRPAASPSLKPSRCWNRWRRHAARDRNMGLLISWLILSIAVWATAAILPGFRVKDFKSAVIVALLFGLLNFLLGWLLFTVFTIATLGLAWLFGFLTRWLINALLLMLTDK